MTTQGFDESFAVNYVTHGFAIRECFLGWLQVLHSFCRSTRIDKCKNFEIVPHLEKLHLKGVTAQKIFSILHL